MVAAVGESSGGSNIKRRVPLYHQVPSTLDRSIVTLNCSTVTLTVLHGNHAHTCIAYQCHSEQLLVQTSHVGRFKRRYPSNIMQGLGVGWYRPGNEVTHVLLKDNGLVAHRLESLGTPHPASQKGSVRHKLLDLKQLLHQLLGS